MKIVQWFKSLYDPSIKTEGDTRDYFIDNLKAFLMVLVILGHVCFCHSLH